jgi:hypothetical protein
MTNSVLRGLLLKRIAAAKYAAEEVAGTTHLGLRGRFREIFVNDLLSPLLLPGQFVGTGVIVDSVGGESAQTDIVVCDKSILPPTLFNEQEGYFPLEACLYAIEVKSRLNSNELKESIEKANRLWSLRPLVDPFRPVPVLFAFGSDLRTGDMEDELDRYFRADQDGKTSPRIPVFCVSQRGYAYFENNQTEGPHWRFVNPAEDCDEIANFLGGFANTLPKFRIQRASTGVPFGNYLLRSQDFKRLKNIQS